VKAASDTTNSTTPVRTLTRNGFRMIFGFNAVAARAVESPPGGTCSKRLCGWT